MANLSVNINKIATLRNSRGGSEPSVVKAALKCEEWGAAGITVHPRPDERHIRYSDVRELKPLLKTEFNIEGNPIPQFMELVLEVSPAQVTLVPDGPGAITSNAGWNTIENRTFLTDICNTLKSHGIRASIFVDPDPQMVRGAKECGADRVELYTEGYAKAYHAATTDQQRAEAIAPYLEAAKAAKECGLGLNAGHDLSLENLGYFIQTIPWTDEVSIGHALIGDAIYLGLETAVKEYTKLSTI